MLQLIFGKEIPGGVVRIDEHQGRNPLIRKIILYVAGSIGKILRGRGIDAQLSAVIAVGILLKGGADDSKGPLHAV